MKCVEKKQSTKDDSTGRNPGLTNQNLRDKHSRSLLNPNRPLVQVQPKLKIGRPNDKYEQEADRVADMVMRMPESGIQQQSTCPECMDEEEKTVQMKSLANKAQPVNAGLQNQIQSLSGGGQPLPQSTRSFFEPRFGHDFSKVKVHTDSKAAEMARSINAKAFTSGRDVVFDSGQYSPEATSGKQLLAHELTHVLQQKGEHLSAINLPKCVKIPQITPLNKPQISTLPYPPIFTPLCIQQAIYAYMHAKKNSDKGEEWQHCYVSCKVATYCDNLTAANLGLLGEIVDMFGPGDASITDLVNDAKGIVCSYNLFSTCDSCCQDELKGQAKEMTGDSAMTKAEADVATSPRLTKVTVAGPTPGPCGNFKWAIKWELDKKTTKGGLVVQKIDSQFDVKSCKGKPYELPKEHYDPSWFPYWEAWEIKKNEQVTNQGTGDDLYKWPFAITDSTGTYTTTGSAEFYDGAQLSKTDFKVMNKPPAGILPMTKNDPKLLGGTGSLTHNLKATWDCCGKGKTKTGDTILETE